MQSSGYSSGHAIGHSLEMSYGQGDAARSRDRFFSVFRAFSMAVGNFKNILYFLHNLIKNTMNFSVSQYR